MDSQFGKDYLITMNKAFLIILDGFGYSEDNTHNAISKAKTPYYDSLVKNYPMSLVQTHGDRVGLPDGVMGNSEVGHLSLGAGRIIYQELSRITKFSKEEGFSSHPMIQKISKQDAALHIMGLVSDGGVHSHIDHLKALCKDLSKTEKKVFVHMFSDGRDTSPTSGLDFAKSLEEEFSQFTNCKLVSASGRFFAMDRDKRWDRVKKAYDCITGLSDGPKYSSVSEGIKASYEAEINDEFIEPFVTNEFEALKPEDQVIFINFRADRARELSMALAQSGFSDFATPVKVKEENYYTFSSYAEDFNFPVLFEKTAPKNSLGEWLSAKGLKQLRIAETEKYAHVTYFFNGGKEEIFAGEDRILVDSPRDVKTYDEKPEMSAPEVTSNLVEAINSSKYDLIVVNYANGDMVGHTGNEEAAIKAVTCLDECLSKIVEAAKAQGYETLITADHGNCEQMIDPKTGKAFTQHSMNLVPLIWIGESAKAGKLKNGGLADIAPSILDLMEIPKPAEMTGQSLIQH